MATNRRIALYRRCSRGAHDGGWISDWKGGAFASAAACLTRARFEATAKYVNAVEVTEFRSDDAKTRNFAARVVEFALVFQAGENRQSRLEKLVNTLPLEA